MFRSFESGYKLCPRCRRAAPLARPQCRRCGHDYERRLAAPGQTLVFRRCPEPLAASISQRHPWPADRSLYACVSLLIALFGLLVWRSLPHTPALTHAHRVIVAQGGLPPG